MRSTRVESYSIESVIVFYERALSLLKLFYGFFLGVSLDAEGGVHLREMPIYADMSFESILLFHF